MHKMFGRTRCMTEYGSIPIAFAKLVPNVSKVRQRTKTFHTSTYGCALRCNEPGVLTTTYFYDHCSIAEFRVI